MARIKTDDITINGWTDEGTAWTHARKPSGFRNRRDRRADVRYEHQHGSHHLLGTSHGELDADMPYAEELADGRWTSIWAFKAGHVYEVDAEIDGEPTKLYIDARDEDRLDEVGEGIVVLEWRAMDADEVAQMTGDEQVESDGEAPTSEDETTTEPPAGTPLTEEELAVALRAEANADPNGPPPASDDADEQSQGEHDFPGVIADWDEMVEAISDEELAQYAERDHRVGIRDLATAEIAQRDAAGDDEDAAPAAGADEEE